MGLVRTLIPELQPAPLAGAGLMVPKDVGAGRSLAGNCTLKEQELEDRDRREAQDGGDENALRGEGGVNLVLLREQHRVCRDRHRNQEHGDREQELIHDKGREHEERHDREDDEPQRGHEVHPQVAGQSL